MTLAALRKLGAPDLPPDHFYRVTEDGFGNFEVEIRIRIGKRKRRSHRLVGADTYVCTDQYDTVEQAIAAACALACSRAEARRRHWRMNAEARAYVGDHS